MDFDEIENLNPEQILEMYEDILETPVKIATCTYYWSCATGSIGERGCTYDASK